MDGQESQESQVAQEFQSEFKTELVAIADIVPHPKNYRQHPDDQLGHIVESIKTHGFYRNIVISADGVILAGHGVVKAATRMGYVSVPVIRVAIDSNDPRALKLLAGDNEISHLGDIDDRALSEILKEIKESDSVGLLGTGYDDAMLANLVYITRSEVQSFEEAAHWVGMPEYENPDEPYQVVVSCETEADRQTFLEKVGATVKSSHNKTWSIWYPEKKTEDLTSLKFRCVSEPPVMPRYPIYIPSKGRYKSCFTAKFLRADGVPFFLVVEPQEQDHYAAVFGEECLLVLPWSNLGITGLIAVRNWIKAHATEMGFERHWQLDDNIRCIYRRFRGRRIPMDAGVALAATEDFVDRYENIAIAGLNYAMFIPGYQKFPPFYTNSKVYSCSLILNALKQKWRSAYNDDTDICLQVIADGWVTVTVNAFPIFKMRTMKVSGGNTTIYQGDGRLKMARALERLWPGVVETRRRFNRPQHAIKYAWQRFDTPLKLKPGVHLEDFEANEYGLQLEQVRPIKNLKLRELFLQMRESYQKVDIVHA